MSGVAHCVYEFHRKFGCPMQAEPNADIPIDVVRMRVDLIAEELDEFIEAVDRQDIVSIADALADLAYVVYGAALTYGIDLDACIAEVHRSNMTKAGVDGKPIFRADGKLLKGPNYTPPNLAAVLFPDGDDYGAPEDASSPRASDDRPPACERWARPNDVAPEQDRKSVV